MPVHEFKTCPHCQQLFECKAGTMEICQCSSIFLTQEERDYIQNLYDDCLCLNCLKKIKSEHEKLVEKETFEIPPSSEPQFNSN